MPGSDTKDVGTNLWAKKEAGILSYKEWAMCMLAVLVFAAFCAADAVFHGKWFGAVFFSAVWVYTIVDGCRRHRRLVRLARLLLNPE
jgi:hypothetical protein